MTPERLAEMDERCKKATPGEWKCKLYTHWPMTGKKNMLSILSTGKPNRSYPGKPGIVFQAESWGDGMNPADAAFIENARTDLPEAIAEIKRLQRVQDEEVTEFNAGHDCALAGGSFDDMPDVKHDLWGCGFAWGAWDGTTAEIKRLQKRVEELEKGDLS